MGVSLRDYSVMGQVLCAGHAPRVLRDVHGGVCRTRPTFPLLPPVPPGTSSLGCFCLRAFAHRPHSLCLPTVRSQLPSLSSLGPQRHGRRLRAGSAV